MAKVDTKGLERHQVLMALTDGTNPMGLGKLTATAEALPEDLARAMIEGRRRRLNPDNDPDVEERRYYFDYVDGRPIKVSLEDPDEFDPRLYDRDAGGDGSAAGLIKRLRFKLGER